MDDIYKYDIEELELAFTFGHSYASATQSVSIPAAKINTFCHDDEAFEHNYHVDITDGKNGFLPNTLQLA
ncbi:hypothetical protein AZE42_06849 [Rhizopogon vesiculosus]|uniref:Uncharacterized protein n=1 Tax=Rhizopogon vesiculosus TaxID=180088 RepID=A0A1J8PGU6_9AGAM|nr:hypothetical protein AZE42_06849 [Rhizopogon vesiculosus]